MLGTQYKSYRTNEHIMKKFTNQFNLALFAMKKAAALIKSDAIEQEDIINVSAFVLKEIEEENCTQGA